MVSHIHLLCVMMVFTLTYGETSDTSTSDLTVVNTLSCYGDETFYEKGVGFFTFNNVTVTTGYCGWMLKYEKLDGKSDTCQKVTGRFHISEPRIRPPIDKTVHCFVGDKTTYCICFFDFCNHQFNLLFVGLFDAYINYNFDHNKEPRSPYPIFHKSQMSERRRQLYCLLEVIRQVFMVRLTRDPLFAKVGNEMEQVPDPSASVLALQAYLTEWDKYFKVPLASRIVSNAESHSGFEIALLSMLTLYLICCLVFIMLCTIQQHRRHTHLLKSLGHTKRLTLNYNEQIIFSAEVIGSKETGAESVKSVGNANTKLKTSGEKISMSSRKSKETIIPSKRSNPKQKVLIVRNSMELLGNTSATSTRTRTGSKE